MMQHIGLAIVFTLVGLFLPADAAGINLDTELHITLCIAQEDATQEGTHGEACFTVSTQPLLSTSTSTITPPSVTPAVRTISRSKLNSERTFQYSKAVSSIDTSTAASRYGLYNHKILFVSLSRIYYLNRLMRLII